MTKKITFILIFVILLVIGYFALNRKVEAPSIEMSGQSNDQSNEIKVSSDDASKYTIDNPESIFFVVNRSKPLSLSYVPQNLVKPNIEVVAEDSLEEQQLRVEAARASEQMFNDAKDQGYQLVMASGYRSANLQRTYYNTYVARDGQEAADKYSAQPGTSEHQTGLALDITTKDRLCYLEICFSDTKEGKWLEENAHKYGFILRYPNNKENTTGYQFEPWHFRYVGNELAKSIYDSNQTIEEFFGFN